MDDDIKRVYFQHVMDKVVERLKENNPDWFDIHRHKGRDEQEEEHFNKNKTCCVDKIHEEQTKINYRHGLTQINADYKDQQCQT